jgi:hypothetical protein
MQPGQMFMVAVPAGAPTEDDYEQYVPMDTLTFDVTDPFESVCLFLGCPCLGFQTKKLVLQDQEVFFRVKNLLKTSKQRRPYAQLGSVDLHKVACGCTAIVSDFAPLNEKGEGGIRPGCCGMDSALAERIVAELQARKHKRGGIGQIRKLDYILGKTVRIGQQIPAMAQQMGATWQKGTKPEFEKQTLTEKTIDVTNNIEMCCGCTTRTLHLGAEEAVLEVNQCFGCQTLRSKREYGEIGFVEKQKSCICCFSIGSDIDPLPEKSNMNPGCPCANRGKVTAIVRELRERMAVRGQVGQIKRQEKLLGFVYDLEQSMKGMVRHKGMSFPPPQEQMGKYFGQEGSPVTLVDAKPPEPPCADKDHDVTNIIDSLCGCCCTLGIAGFTKETLQLRADDMHILTKNNLDDSDAKIPYAEMDSVDMGKSCCCCWSVNDQSPGFGCNKSKVTEITADLQERKFKRGNIAHLAQLRSMQGTAAGLNVMMDMLLDKDGISCPPPQQDMDKIWAGGTKPYALRNQLSPPHIAPDKDFQTRKFNVTNYPEAICTCLCCPCAGCTTRELDLGPDELTITSSNFCDQTTSRIPYGNLGSVETELTCCFCHELPDVANPGCGCSRAVVDAIAEELQERKVKRGNIAQMKQQENIILELLKLEAKADVMAYAKFGIAFPPPPEVMSSAFVASSDLAALGKPVEAWALPPGCNDIP